jgi:hypothetical protein
MFLRQKDSDMNYFLRNLNTGKKITAYNFKQNSKVTLGVVVIIQSGASSFEIFGLLV